MKKGKYDEFQLAKRHKIAFQTLILVFVVIGINGYVKSSYGIWADPYLESYLLIMVPGLYFAGASIWQNAYFRLKDYPMLTLLLSGFVMVFSLLLIGLKVGWGEFHLIEDGKLGGDIELVLFSVLFTMVFVLLMVRRRLDRHL